MISAIPDIGSVREIAKQSLRRLNRGFGDLIGKVVTLSYGKKVRRAGSLLFVAQATSNPPQG